VPVAEYSVPARACRVFSPIPAGIYVEVYKVLFDKRLTLAHDSGNFWFELSTLSIRKVFSI